MKYLIIGIITLLVLFIVKYLRKKRVEKNRINKLLSEPSSSISEEEKLQDQKNCKFIADLIHGNYSKISGKARRKSIKAFEQWQQKLKFLFKLASPKVIKLRNKYISENKANIFNPTYVQVSPCKGGRPEGWQLFIKNGFTEPFPSTHDMPEWAIMTQLADIFILNGITPEESESFVFHLKRHYVNHKMVQGIIQFDLYKIP